MIKGTIALSKECPKKSSTISFDKPTKTRISGIDNPTIKSKHFLTKILNCSSPPF